MTSPSHTIDDVVTISSNPSLGSAEMLAALRREGLDVEHLPEEGESVDEGAVVLVISVSDAPADLARCVLAALEQLVADGPAPLVPEETGPRSFLVRPPAG